MSEDALIERVAVAIQTAERMADYAAGDSGNLYRWMARAALKAIAATVVPGYTTVDTDDLRALLDALAMMSIVLDGTGTFLRSEERDAFDRLRAQVGDE